MSGLIERTERRKGKLASVAYVKEGYTKSFDGTEIFYRVSGKGKTTLVCVNGLGTSTFFWDFFEKFFKNNYTVVTWDFRGHGRSRLKKDVKNFTIDALIKDCQAVLKTLKIKRAVFLGYSMGTQIVLEIYRRFPEMVTALIPTLGTYGRPMDTFYNTWLSRYIYHVIVYLGINYPKLSNLFSTLVLKNPLSFQVGGLIKVQNTSMVAKEYAEQYINHVLSLDPKLFTYLLKDAQEHSSEDMLGTINVPTLILAAEYDQFTPVWISKKMNRLIPDSELFIVKKGTHAALVEQPELMNFRIEKFLKERL